MESKNFYERQTQSGALINANSEAFIKAKLKHQKVLSDKKRLENLENEISDIKNKYTELLDINNQILSILKNKGQ